MENNITTNKLCTACTLLSRDMVIQITNMQEAKKSRKENNWTNVPRHKAKVAQKQYSIVALRISVSKIDLMKADKTKEKIVM